MSDACTIISRSINTARVDRMTIIGDATTWCITSDNFRVVIYYLNIFIIQATGINAMDLHFKMRLYKLLQREPLLKGRERYS